MAHIATLLLHRRRNQGGHGPPDLKMSFGPYSFGKVKGIVLSDLYGW